MFTFKNKQTYIQAVFEQNSSIQFIFQNFPNRYAILTPIFKQLEIWPICNIRYTLACFLLFHFREAGGQIDFLLEGILNLQPPIKSCPDFLVLNLLCLQGCSGKLNGNSPYAGTLLWSITGADLKGIYITIPSFEVSVSSQMQIKSVFFRFTVFLPIFCLGNKKDLVCFDTLLLQKVMCMISLKKYLIHNMGLLHLL